MNNSNPQMKPLPGRIEAAVKALRENQWDRNKAAFAMHINKPELERLIIAARQAGHVVRPDAHETAEAKRQRESRMAGKVGLHLLTHERKEPDNVTTNISVSMEEIDEAHERYGGKINIQIARKNWSAARKLIDLAELDEAGKLDELDPFEEIPLAEITDLRTANCLEEKHDAIWIKDLLKVGSEKMLATSNFSYKALDSLLKGIIHKAKQRDDLRALAEMQAKRGNR